MCAKKEGTIGTFIFMLYIIYKMNYYEGMNYEGMNYEGMNYEGMNYEG
jgi:hypothetical protein